MRTIYVTKDNLNEQQISALPQVAALGNFDGIHIGHQEVIQTASQVAKVSGLSLAVISFYPHPKTVIGGENKVFPYLMSLEEKQHKLQGMGVDTFYVIEFTKEFAGLRPMDFVKDYLLNLQVKHAVAGFDFTYGFKGAGTMEDMVTYGEKKLKVTTVDKVIYQGEKVSSTRIRECIHNGEVENASQLLTRDYEISCTLDQKFLIPSNNAVIPEEGEYIVTLQYGEAMKRTIVQILNQQNRKVLKTYDFKILNNYQKINVIWHQTVSPSAEYAISY